jgi:hypothetical protein
MKVDMKSGIHKTRKYLISHCKGGVIRKLQALPICIRGVIKAAMKRLEAQGSQKLMDKILVMFTAIQLLVERGAKSAPRRTRQERLTKRTVAPTLSPPPQHHPGAYNVRCTYCRYSSTAS